MRTPARLSSYGLLRAGPALRRGQQGRWGYILAWLIGVPVPILIVIYLLRGCTG
jgi:hypothetical protein